MPTSLLIGFTILGFVVYVVGLFVCSLALINGDDDVMDAAGKFLGCLFWPLIVMAWGLLILIGWLSGWKKEE